MEYEKAIYSFGEMVIIDGSVSGQIVDFYCDGIYTVEINGTWNFVNEKRIEKDI